MIPELSDNDRMVIHERFLEIIVPKLQKHSARLGTIGCDFAGEKYRNWCIRFESIGSDFELVDFEYDENGSGLDLDL